MLIHVNGESQAVRARTVLELLRELGLSAPERSPESAPGRADSGAGAGLAVAVNEEVVPRAAHADRELCAGDRVEIIRAVQGG